jgi:hypothetical protein
MSLQARFESLKERHATLEARIFEEGHRPKPNDTALSQLKMQKLRIKDEMEAIKREV